MRVAILLTVLSLVANAEFFWGRCPSPAVVQPFDVSRYIGQWWEIARVKDVPYQAATRCVTATYGLNSDGTVSVVNSNYDGDEYKTVTGYAKCVGDSAQCSVKFSYFAPGGDYEVLDTDYDSYAVVWSCYSFFLFHFEWSWILGRGTGLVYDADMFIDIVANKTSLLPDEFVKDDNENCPSQTKLFY